MYCTRRATEFNTMSFMFALLLALIRPGIYCSCVGANDMPPKEELIAGLNRRIQNVEDLLNHGYHHAALAEAKNVKAEWDK